MPENKLNIENALQSKRTYLEKHKELIPPEYKKKYRRHAMIRVSYRLGHSTVEGLSVNFFLIELTPKNIPGQKHKKPLLIAYYQPEEAFENDNEILLTAKELLRKDIIGNMLRLYTKHQEVLNLQKEIFTFGRPKETFYPGKPLNTLETKEAIIRKLNRSQSHVEDMNKLDEYMSTDEGLLELCEGLEISPVYL